MRELQWKGKAIVTVGDIVSALHQLANAHEANAFIGAFRKADKNADANVGYCIGYIGGDDADSVARRAELHAWTGVGHPVYGTGGY